MHASMMAAAMMRLPRMKSTKKELTKKELTKKELNKINMISGKDLYPGYYWIRIIDLSENIIDKKITIGYYGGFYMYPWIIIGNKNTYSTFGGKDNIQKKQIIPLKIIKEEIFI